MRIPIYVFFILFVLSGFSGLIYESIWSHYLKLFLGHAAYAQTLVLAMFMGGMAIGSAISAKFSHRWKNLLLGYATVEAVIGLFALLFHQVFISTTDLAFESLIPLFSENPFMITTVKWGLASLIILPQSILLGMTFPLMVAGVLRKYPGAGGREISTLYFTNSFGGVFGVLVSSFVLIQHMGLPGTIMTAGFINILLALAVWLLAAGDNLPLVTSKPAFADTELSLKSITTPTLLLLISFLTGLSSFMYEIGWIRMLSLVLGSSTHSFELMLAAFILGLALGGWWLRKRIDHLKNPIQFLGYVQILMGLFAIISLVVFHYSFDAMLHLMDTIQRKESTYPFFLFTSALLCLVMMLPATFCAGMTLPLITKLAIKSEAGERGIGFIYASNTLGAIIGIFLSIHLVMPLFGLKVLITSGAIIDIILGFVLLMLCIKHYTEQNRVALPVAVMLILAALTTAFMFDFDKQRLSSGVFRTGAYLTNSENMYYQDGKTSTVSIFKVNNQITLTNNGKPDASVIANEKSFSKEESTQTLLGILPLLHNPSAEKAAIIGMGSGLSTHALLASTQIKQVDTIEIEAAVVEASNLFRPKSERAYSDQRSFIHIDDAKTFFTAQGHKYDIIVSEPPNPWVSGVSSLFTQEFYRRVKNHMTQNAVFVQWLHLYEIDIDLVATVFNALGKEFSDYRVYASNDAGDIIIVAKKEGPVSPALLPTSQNSEITNMLSHHDIHTDNDLQLHLVSSKKILDPAFNSYTTLVNSDYFPYLENGAARARFAKATSLELFKIHNYPVPVTRSILTDMNIDSSNYTYSNFYQPAANMYSANIVKQLLLDSKTEDKNIDGRADQRFVFMTVLKQQLSSCSIDQLEHTTRSLHKLAVNTLPYLSQNELGLIWQNVANSDCIKSTAANNDLIQWLALYKAISNRNAQAMLQLSEQLLISNPEIEKDLSVFLVISALLGNYYMEEDRSHEILEKWQDKLAGTSAETLLAVAILTGR